MVFRSGKATQPSLLFPSFLTMHYPLGHTSRPDMLLSKHVSVRDRMSIKFMTNRVIISSILETRHLAFKTARPSSGENRTIPNASWLSSTATPQTASD